MAILPDGVWWGVAGEADATKFLIVSQLEHDDTYVLPGRIGWERFVYLVKAVTKGKSGTEVKQASYRVYQLLQDAILTVPGYWNSNEMHRLERVRYLEYDEPTDTRWQHRGGHYEVLITPT
jgi:hypothetical protein